MWRRQGLAWAAVVAWHALIGWWLLRVGAQATGGQAGDALQVVYVTLPPAVPRAPATPRHATRRAASTGGPPASRHRQTSPSQPVAYQVEPERARARSLLDQAADYARASQSAPLRIDPLADRPQKLPQADAGRFRMRTAITPAGAVAWTARHLFAPMIPRGYDPDPCPRNRDNIAELATAGDSAALAGELEFERRHCRP
jgi:hypothetical protein